MKCLNFTKQKQKLYLTITLNRAKVEYINKPSKGR